MTWGNDLWNQTEKVANHTQTGIEFLERFTNFVKDKALIESEYSKQLNNLVKRYQPKKKENDDEIQFSYVKAFGDSLFEIHQIAVQHEFIGEYYRETILVNLNSLIQSLKEERKSHFSDISRQHQNLKNSVDNMAKMKKLYIEAFRSSEEAQSKYQKADFDLNSTRGAVDKKKTEAITKQNICEDAKTSYASQLCKTNELQISHYTHHLPSVFDKLEMMDKKRIEEFKNFFLRCMEMEKKTSTGVAKSLLTIEKHCQGINAENDSQMVVDRFKAEAIRPSDYTFVDMNAEVSQSHRISRGDMSTDVDQVRSKRLHETIEGIKKQIKIITDEREACIRMKKVYSEKPQLGDAQKIEIEINNFNDDLNRLTSDLKQYEISLQETQDQQANGRFSFSTLPKTPEQRTKDKPSFSNDIFSTLRQSRGTPEANKSPKSKSSIFTLPKMKTGQGSYDVKQESLDDSFDLDFDSEPARILGSCKAMFDFLNPGTNEGTISMKEGEQFYVLELDAGDGWTKVRSKTSSEEGFVPTTYLNCSLSL